VALRGIQLTVNFGDPRVKRFGTVAIVIGALLAISNGAFAMALATGHLDGGGAELFPVVFGFVLALGFLTLGIYIRNNVIARERSPITSK
jgi:hypothetical protein